MIRAIRDIQKCRMQTDPNKRKASLFISEGFNYRINENFAFKNIITKDLIIVKDVLTVYNDYNQEIVVWLNKKKKNWFAG